MSAPIIITVPNNYLAVDDLESKVVVDVAPTPSNRKRRLDHLTWEEKMQRKKLKNRVAAQTSRDRKKAKMDEMESRIKQCMDMNERLFSEVESLKALNERLLSENAALRSAAAARDVAGAPRPAVSYPQQKEGPLTASRAARILLAMLTLSQNYSPTSTPPSTSTLFTNLPTHFSKKLLQVIQERINIESRSDSQCNQGGEVVGTSAKQLESGEGGVLSSVKQDIDRILAQHSYAHPYPDTDIEIKEESNDKGDMFYASYEENDCITVEVPSDDQVSEMPSIDIETEFNILTDKSSDVTLECDMKLLSPMTLSPNSCEENLFGASPSHTNLSSDLGYESLSSPLSEPESMDLSDFWCDSFSELFPGLA